MPPYHRLTMTKISCSGSKPKKIKELHPWEFLGNSEKIPFRNQRISVYTQAPLANGSVLTISKLQQLRQFGSSTILQMIGGIPWDLPASYASYLFLPLKKPLRYVKVKGTFVSIWVQLICFIIRHSSKALILIWSYFWSANAPGNSMDLWLLSGLFRAI